MKNKTIELRYRCHTPVCCFWMASRFFNLFLLLALVSCNKTDDAKEPPVDPAIIASMTGKYTGTCFVETHQNGIHFDTMPAEFFVDSIVPLTDYYQKFYVRGYFIIPSEFLIYNEDFDLDSFHTRLIGYENNQRRIVDLTWLNDDNKWRCHILVQPTIGVHYAYMDVIYSKQ